MGCDGAPGDRAREVQERGMFVPPDRALAREKRAKGLPDPGERELFSPSPARGGGLGRGPRSRVAREVHFALRFASRPSPPPTPALPRERGRELCFDYSAGAEPT